MKADTAFLGFGCSLLAVAMAVPAQAAETLADEQATTSRDMGEIIVTARKRAESAQDVPVALTVASEQDLVNRSVINVTDIQQQTPSLRFSQAALNATGVYLAARGLIVTDTRLTTDPAVGLYVDGVYIPRTVGLGATDMFDASRVEVLKGPQGTLYGKNNTGGAVNVWYNEPTDRLEGKIRLRAAEHGEFSGGAVANVPFSDMAALRVVGQAIYRQGYGRNVTTGDALGKLSSQSFRGTLKLEPTDRITITARADYLNADATGMAYKGGTDLVGSAMSEVLAEMGLANTPANQAIALAAYQSYTRGNKNDGAMDVNPYSRTQTWGYSGTIDFALTDTLGLKSITAWRHIRDRSAVDLDGSPFKLIAYDDHVIRDNQFSQELQLSADLLEGRLNLILGGYYANETGYEKSLQTTLGVLTAARGPAINEADIRNRTLAAFAQGTFRITDRLNFTAGGRYTEDRRRFEANNRNNLTCLSLGTNFVDLTEPCTTGELNAKFDAFSWTLSLDYKVTDEVMVFARADKGYRTGGFPLTGGASPVATLTPTQNRAAAAASFAPVKPEYAMSYELGFKADLFDRLLRLNASYYNVKYTDLQKNVSGVVPGSNPPAIINLVGNAAKARVEGVEADAMLRPVDGLELGGAVSWIKPKYIRYDNPGLDSSGNQVFVDFSPLPFVEVPKWTYSLTGAYTFPVDTANVRLQLDYSWQDKVVASVSQTLNATRTEIASILTAVRPSNESLNGRVSVNLESGLSVAVFGRNLTRDQFGNFPLALQATLGIRTIAGMNAPRTFGIELTKDF